MTRISSFAEKSPEATGTLAEARPRIPVEVSNPRLQDTPALRGLVFFVSELLTHPSC